jgi:hypothetical protein
MPQPGCGAYYQAAVTLLIIEQFKSSPATNLSPTDVNPITPSLVFLTSSL